MDLDHIVPELRDHVMKVSDIQFDEQNCRVHNEDSLIACRNSLQRFGQRHALIVRDGVVIAGNARLQAAIDLGWEYVAVTSADDLSHAEATVLAITDNKTSDISYFSEDKLSEVMRDLEVDEVKISDWFNLGWSDKELTDLGLLDVDDMDMPDLPSGEKNPIRQMTFTVHEEQHEIIEQALKKAKSEGASVSHLNENSNGNALHEICRIYLG